MSDTPKAAPATSLPGTVTTPPSGAGDSTPTQIQPGAPAALTAPGLPVVPGYAVSREIARGGMGTVYAAHDPIFDREVAIKVMHFGQDAGRFAVEARITARLPHPGVPPVYALGTIDDGRPFLAMKLIEGHTLAEELAPGRTDLPRFLGVFEAICLTVGFAHSRGVVHRDLKPLNVMVGAFGEVQVMDWGLAKHVGADEEPLAASRRSGADETEAGQVKGTPAYMAPEQARGEPIDARADVFGLGGILAAILTGRPPFFRETARATVEKAAAADLREALTDLDASGADSELIAVAKRCLAPNAADRYSSGAEVAAAVSAYRAGVEERLRRAERERAVSAAEAREQRKRREVQLALLAAVALFLVAGGGVGWWLDRRAGEQKLADERARAEQQRVEGEAREVAARLAGERAERAAQARAGVHANLTLARELRKQYKFKEAGAAMAQAADLARGAAPEFFLDAERAQRDLAFVARLDGIRYRKWLVLADAKVGGPGGFQTKQATQDYRRAFADYGLDVAALPPTEAAGRVASSPIADELVAALDDWATHETDETVRNRLLEVARRAAPGPWTDRLRDPAVRTDKAALAKLEADAHTANVPATALSALVVLLDRNQLNPLPVLTIARARAPNNFDLAFALGSRRAGKGAGAHQQISGYEVARTLRPDNLVVLVNLGSALQDAGDNSGAVAAYREALRLDPRAFPAHYNLGLALYQKGDRPGAIAEWREALKTDATFARAHYNVGNALDDLNDFDGAVAAWKEAIRHDPAYGAAYTNWGFALHNRGRHDDAVEVYKKGIAANPQYVQTYVNLGTTYLAQKKLPEAIATARQAVAADPQSGMAYAMLGDLLLKTGDIPGARAAITEAVRLDRRWSLMQARLPPLAVAPPPRERKP